jgi:hypothetical protein
MFMPPQSKQHAIIDEMVRNSLDGAAAPQSKWSGKRNKIRNKGKLL